LSFSNYNKGNSSAHDSHEAMSLENHGGSSLSRIAISTSQATIAWSQERPIPAPSQIGSQDLGLLTLKSVQMH
jgi:hypothetical protein